jgi:hypothetical protein
VPGGAILWKSNCCRPLTEEHLSPPATKLGGGFLTQAVAEPHSGLMLAARITLPHFSVSLAMSLPNQRAKAQALGRQDR